MVENSERSEFLKKWTKSLMTTTRDNHCQYFGECPSHASLCMWCKELPPEHEWVKEQLYATVLLLGILCRALDIMSFIFPSWKIEWNYVYAIMC